MVERQAFITREGYEKLVRELHDLKSIKRKEIAWRIQEAKELGDLSENAEYQDAKNEQAFIEGRIFELDSLLKNVTVVDEKRTSGVIEFGSKVKTRSDGSTHEYIIVGSKEADPSLGKISNESPVGRAFLGRKVGDVIEINTAKGSKRFEVLSVS